jgi:hypothetical protein
MPFDFAAAKTLARRVVHSTFGVPAYYKGDAMSEPVLVRARLHEATTVYGDLLDQGFANTVEAVDRIVFIPSQETQPFNPVRLAEITFPHRPGIKFILETKDVADGPLEVTWQATRSNVSLGNS